MSDLYQLDRFVNAQNRVFETVLNELNAGKKQSHWMWYVFPQLKGLGHSSLSEFYGIIGIDEARAFFSDPILRNRYHECLEILLNIPRNNPVDIFGYTDSIKFLSSLTLFSFVEPDNTLIQKLINKYFNGITDFNTKKLLGIV